MDLNQYSGSFRMEVESLLLTPFDGEDRLELSDCLGGSSTSRSGLRYMKIEAAFETQVC